MLLTELFKCNVNLIIKCDLFPKSYLPKVFEVVDDNHFRYRLNEDIYCTNSKNICNKMSFDILFYLEVRNEYIALCFCENDSMFFEYNKLIYTINLMTIYNLIHYYFDKIANYYTMENIYPIDCIKSLTTSNGNIKIISDKEKSIIKNICVSGPYILPSVKDCMMKYYDDQKKGIQFYEFSIKTLNNNCYYYLTGRNMLLFE